MTFEEGKNMKIKLGTNLTLEPTFTEKKKNTVVK